jgi:hypothetical protein
VTIGAGAGAFVLVVDGDVELAAWRLDRPERIDLSVIDALARMQLLAQRCGLAIRVRNPCQELRALLDLVGLADVVLEDRREVERAVPELLLETGRQAEGVEQLGVQEVVEPGDPPA